MTELILFASVFTSVFALGVQSLNVNNGHYVAAFLTSFIIGISTLALYRYMPDPTWSQVAAYLLGGPFGIVTAMWVHRRTIGRKPKEAELTITVSADTSQAIAQFQALATRMEGMAMVIAKRSGDIESGNINCGADRP